MFSGKFERGCLPYVLKQICDSEKGGELVCTNDSGKRSFVVEDRHIVGFQSNYPEDDLANFLFQQKILRKDEYDVLISRALEGNNTEDLIIQSQIIEEDVLRRQQALRIESALLDTNNRTDGDYEFSDGLLVSFAEGSLRVPVLSCMVRLLRNEISPELAIERLGGEKALLRPGYNWQAVAAQLELSPQEGFVLSRLTTPMRVQEVLEIVPLPQQQVIPILHMMLVLGLVSVSRADDPVPATAPATQRHQGVPSSAEESIASEIDASEQLHESILALLEEQQNATFYEVLGVEESASAEDIKGAYHKLAKEYHPDRFSGDSVTPELRRSVDDLFEKIRAAYETLRDERSRGDYDRNRAGGRSGHATSSSSALTEDPEKMAEMSFRQGVQYYQQRDFFNAVQLFKEAVRLQPEVSKYRSALAKAMMRNPRWRKEAEENFKKAIELDEFNADLRVELGRLYLDAGMPRKAEAQFREALAWEADNAKALNELVKMESEQPQTSLLGKLFGGKKKKS